MMCTNTKVFLGNFEEEEVFRDKHVLLKVDSCKDGIVKSLEFLYHHGAKTTIIMDHKASESGLAYLQEELSKRKIRIAIEDDHSGSEPDCSFQDGNSDVILLRHFWNYDAINRGRVLNTVEALVSDTLSGLNDAMFDAIAVRCIGFQLRREFELLQRLSYSPCKPYIAVVAGDVALQRADLLNTLLPHVDKLLIAGEMASTFLRVQGGDHLYQHTSTAKEEEKSDEERAAKAILAAAKQRGLQILLASDVRILPAEVVAMKKAELAEAETGSAGESAQREKEKAKSSNVPLNLDYSSHKAIQLGVKRVPLSVSATPAGPLFKPVADSTRIVPVHSIPKQWVAVDVGPNTMAAFSAALAGAATVLWAGALGKCMHGEYADGTRALLKAVSARTEQGATTVLCGADLVEALRWEVAHQAAAVTANMNATTADGDEEVEGQWRFTQVCSGGDAALRVLELGAR